MRTINHLSQPRISKPKKSRGQRTQGASWLLFSLPLVFLLLFYFYPLGKIFIFSFFEDNVFAPEVFYKVVIESIYLKILWFTIWQALLSTVITVLFALPGAYIFAKFRFVGRDLLLALMIIPFIMPTVVTAAAFRALLGDNGLINNTFISAFSLTTPPVQIEQSVTFFLLAHLFYNYTLVVKIVSSYWHSIDANLTSAAKMLGSSPWNSFRHVTLPLILPAISSAALLVFIFCFTSFGVILILGGPGFATLEVEIYRQTVQMFNLPVAATLSILQILFNFLLMWLHAWLSKRSKITFFTSAATTTLTRPPNLFQRFILYSNLTFILVLVASPLFALFLMSFQGVDGLTVNYYLALFTSTRDSIFFVEPASAVINSLFFATVSMIIALFLGLLAANFLAKDRGSGSTFWDAIIMLPLATSAVTLGFGYIISLNKPPLNLRDSLALVPIAHSLVALPFVVRCLMPALRQIPKSLTEAAIMLGKSPIQVWWQVELPHIKKSLLVAAIFSFCISMGEFGASSFVVRPHTPTMPVAIFRFLSQPGEMNYGQAMAMSSILMIITCASFWILSKIEGTSVARLKLPFKKHHDEKNTFATHGK